MTRDSTTATPPPIGAVIRDRIRDLRDQAGLGRDELAERARQHGAGESFTANVVGFLERGRRGLAVDELLALAGALEISPLELLGDQAHVFVGATATAASSVCPRCDGLSGAVEDATRAAVDELGELHGTEHATAAAAFALAQLIDSGDPDTLAKTLPSMVRELRASLRELTAARAPKLTPAGGGPVDEMGGLGEPV